MAEKTLENIIRCRRSIRAFQDVKIPMEALEKLVELASYAPSGSNAQAWEFIAINEKEKMKKFLRFSPGLFEVPGAMVFLCTNTEMSLKKAGILGRDTMSVMDISMAAQNFMLAAYEMGYGTCALKGYDADAAALLLGLPRNIRPDLLIILGVPGYDTKTPVRRPVSEIMHKGGWDKNA